MATCPGPEGTIVAPSHPGAPCRQWQGGTLEVQEVKLGVFWHNAHLSPGYHWVMEP